MPTFVSDTNDGLFAFHMGFPGPLAWTALCKDNSSLHMGCVLHCECRTLPLTSSRCLPIGYVEGVHGSSDRQSGGHPTTAHCVPHAQSASQSCPESCSLTQSHFEDQIRVRTPHSPGIGLSPGCHYSPAASHSAHLCTMSPCARPQV